MPKIILISGADDGYMALAQDLFASLRDHKFKYSFDLGLLDVGLSDANKAWFKSNNIHVEQAKSDIEYPSRAVWEARQPSYRTLSARPFLPRYFPGYDLYVWIDADIWVQTPEAIDVTIESALTNDAFHIAMEFDRSYKTFFETPLLWSVYADWYKACYNDDNINAHMTLKPMLNCGFWAASKNSPFWATWLKIYSDALQKIPDLTNQTIMTDQLAANIAVYMQGVPSVTLPANYNWLTFFGTPMLDRKTGLYVEPAPPYKPISQFHLTQKPKTKLEKIPFLHENGFVERPLTYQARKG